VATINAVVPSQAFPDADESIPPVAVNSKHKQTTVGAWLHTRDGTGLGFMTRDPTRRGQ